MTPARARAVHGIPNRPYPLGRLVAATALLILVLIGVTAGVLVVSFQDAVRQQKTNLRNLAIAFSAQTFNVAQAIDGAMGQAEREFAAQPAHQAAPVALVDVGENSLGQDILRIDVYDAGAALLASAVPPRAAAPPLPAREVRAALAAPLQRLQIRISDVDPSSGRGTLVFARPLRAGGRGGTIVAQVDSARFNRLYSMVELGKGGSITLFNRDGTMLVRGPNFPAGIGHSFAATPLFTRYLPAGERGGAAEPSPLDGQPRLYGYDTISTYPLVVIAGIDRADALADWYGRLWMAVMLLVLIALTVTFLAWRVARDARRQSRLIGELAASEARAGNSAAYLAAILNAVGTPIWVLDSARRIVMRNDAFSRFVGRGAAELVGRDEAAAFDPAGAGARARRYQTISHSAQPSESIAEMTDGAGAPRTVLQLSSKLLDASGQAQIVSVLTDITERQNAERRLSYIANFDQLTGLPNQGQFRRLLEAEVAGAAASGACIGMLAVSLERVQEIIDLLGHEAGDSALRQIGAVFAALLPQAKAVARVKGNEFAVLVEAGEGRAGLAAYAAALQQRLAGALRVGEREFYLGPLIGVAMYPEDGFGADELLRRADSARGGAAIDDAIHFYSERAQTDLDARLTVEAQLRRALERAEFRLVYQPKIDIGTGRIVGVEALLRWNNAVLGQVEPARFIPIAERTGLIIPIGAWVLQQAAGQLQQWRAQGSAIKVAVNLSPRQFCQADLLATISQCVADCAIAPGSLELEITESALMSREDEVDALLQAIRALGIELSIDDFGTGYSSLAYLKRFPVQRLKVDRAFIGDLGIDADSAAIVASIVNLAHGLKLRVVAEGVETAQQLAILRAMGCDEFQGYLFSRPVEADAVAALFEQNRAATA